MANNTSRVLSALPLGALIGGPLKAVIEAQALAARETVEFIKIFGCKPDPKKVDGNSDDDVIEQDLDAGILREMIFHFSTENEDGTTRQHTLSAPLLSLIPIPVMSVQNMELDFAIKIDEMVKNRSEYETKRTHGNSHSSNQHNWWHGGHNNYHYNARYTDQYTGAGTSSSQTKTASSLAIKINVTSESLPLGLTKFLSTIDRLVAEHVEDEAPAAVTKKQR